MNAARRKDIQALSSEAQELAERIKGLEEEEQEYYDNMPEAFQNDKKGDASQNAIDLLSSAADAMESLVNDLDEAAQ